MCKAENRGVPSQDSKLAMNFSPVCPKSMENFMQFEGDV